MGNWLSRIDPRRGKKNEPETPPQYEVECVCGTRSVGLRRERYQQVLCKTCGEALFVLPINVYPEPPPEKPRAKELAGPPKPPPLPRDGSPNAEASADDDLLAELSEESRRREKERILGGAPTVPQPPKRLTRRERRKQAKQKKAEEKRKRAEDPLTARVPLRQRLRRVFSPFRMVVVSIIGLIAATVGWQVHQRNIDSARLTFENDRKDGLAAMASGDFRTAEELFVSAANAADLVGRDDVGAHRVRRLAIESAVINDLTDRSLFEAVQSASDSRGQSAAQRVVDVLADRYVVLETRVVPDGRTDEGPRFGVEVPLFLNQTFVEAEVIGGEFEQLALSQDGSSVIFAAKVESAWFGQDAGQDFLMLTLDADSVHLWTDKRTLAAIGLELDELTLKTLTNQSKLFGIK